ncbi:hypothetical protein GQ600_4840 [Phytophthora cactorum]
MGIQ